MEEDIKKFLGLPVGEGLFDTQIDATALSLVETMTQLGFPPAVGFDLKLRWEDVYPYPVVGMIRLWYLVKMRLLIDPPPPNASQSFGNTLKELEWRIRNSNAF